MQLVIFRKRKIPQAKREAHCGGLPGDVKSRQQDVFRNCPEIETDLAREGLTVLPRARFRSVFT
jgi:hypothetical protein